MLRKRDTALLVSIHFLASPVIHCDKHFHRLGAAPCRAEEATVSLGRGGARRGHILTIIPDERGFTPIVHLSAYPSSCLGIGKDPPRATAA